jgi:DNA-binding transcriptional ArsR family regulator
VNQSADRLDAVFAALGNAHRRRIVDLLSLQPASIHQIAGQIGMSLTTISRHVDVLEEAQLIIRRKVGRVTFLSIRRSTMRRVQEWALQYDTSWGTDDESLANYVPAMHERDITRQRRRIDEEVPVPLQGIHDADA